MARLLGHDIASSEELQAIQNEFNTKLDNLHTNTILPLEAKITQQKNMAKISAVIDILLFSLLVTILLWK